MEKQITAENYVLKNPCFIKDIQYIIDNYKIKFVIIPIRNYDESAKSRVFHGEKCGGLWNANDHSSQKNFFHEIMANYIYYMTKFEIPTIFLDFDKMTNEPYYLYDKLKFILQEKNITYTEYIKEFNLANDTSKPQK
jgi:hypothetical protein